LCPRTQRDKAYDEIYLIIVGLFSIAIYETLRELFALSRSTILEDSTESPTKMNFDPASLLRTHFKRILGKQCFSPDMIEILRLTRLIIEQEKWTNRYPTLSFYCDWAQTADDRVQRRVLRHREIDPHPHALVILEKINDILLDQGGGDVSVVNREISRAFGFAALRQEMFMVFMSKSIPTDIVNSMSNWRGFLGAVLDDFSHRPIRLPDNTETKGKGEAKAVFDRMVNRNKSLGRRVDLVARALFVQNRTNDVGEPGRPAGFYWRLLLRLHPPVELDGQLVFTETLEDFSRP
jgi:hypothetical protein